MKRIILYTLVLFGLMFSSCIDKPTYPSAPVIAYKDFIRYGNKPSDPDSMEVVVSFTDNEGDIGLGKADTQGIFKYGNIWMDYYYWDTIGGGHWATDIPWTPQLDTFKIAYRVPPVLPEGDPSEPMKGLIYVKQRKATPNSPPIVSDKKIKYVIYLYDRALHKSDTVHTPALIF